MISCYNSSQQHYFYWFFNGGNGIVYFADDGFLSLERVGPSKNNGSIKLGNFLIAVVG
jgi:hypothetical protein